MNIAGRFHIYARSASCIVVGCVGRLWSADLTAENLRYIRGFYSVPETWTQRREEDWPQQVLPRGNFNDFIVFEKGE